MALIHISLLVCYLLDVTLFMRQNLKGKFVGDLLLTTVETSLLANSHISRVPWQLSCAGNEGTSGDLLILLLLSLDVQSGLQMSSVKCNT